MNLLTKVSLRTKIIGLVLFVISLIGVGGLYAFNQFGDKYAAEMFNNQSDGSKVLAQKIAAQFYERYGDIQAFALNPITRELNAKRLPQILDEYVKLYGIYDVILVVDKNGKFVASNQKDSNDKPVDIKTLSTKSYADSPWFKSIMAGNLTEDKAKGFTGTYFEDLQVDPIYGLALNQPKRTGVSFSAPITNELGDIVGIITNRANNKWFETEMAAAWDMMKVKDAEVTLVNKEGFVISNLAPKDHGGKMEFDDDLEKVLFKENVAQNHQPVGAQITAHKSGAIISKDIKDPSPDLVGFAYIDDPKWITSIGWTTMVHVDADEAMLPVTKAKNNFYLIFAMISFVGIAIAVWFGLVVSKTINHITQGLSTSSKEVNDAATKIASQATQLSESATEQAAALQETVAAVDEISAMVEKNADNANKSKEVSSQSREAAQNGQEIVSQMKLAMSEISDSNQEISDQMTESNKRIGEITNLIADIGVKTKVINEIVFQTKLLSFNASVEAARAGEYGKGFAVVAEEVGNLARMSGSAAKEITDMLEQSTRQVQSIVTETKERVEKIMATSKEKVSLGTEKTEACSKALTEILENVESVDSLVAEIATASSEQSQGIQEISKAVGQLEAVTQQNSSVAQSSSVAAEQLNAQASALNGSVLELSEVVTGNQIQPVGNSEPKQNRSHKNSSSTPSHQNDSDNIVNLKGRSKKVSPKKSAAPAPSYSPAAHEDDSLKKASGGDFVPSANDPGFEE